MMKRQLLTGVALLGAISATQAATFTQTETFSGTPILTETLTFDKFNGQVAGSLIGIEITYEMSVTGGSLGVDNDGAAPATVTVELGATGDLSSSDVTLLDASFANVWSISASESQNFNLATDDGDGANYQAGGADNAVMGPINESDNVAGNVNGIFFAQYSGAGTFDIDAEIGQILDFGGNGGVAGTFTATSASGSVTVKYITDFVAPAVPDSGSSAALLAIGFGAIGVAGARRRNS